MVSKKVKYGIIYPASILAAGVVGAYVGNVTFRDYVGPKFADSVNLDGDNREDLLFRDRFGRPIGYLLAPKDGKGRFKSLDMIEEEQAAEFKGKQVERRKLIEERVRNLK